MATVNRKIRRSVVGVITDLHPETEVAQIKKTTAGEALSNFSVALLGLEDQGHAEDDYLFWNNATGAIEYVNDPSYFGAIVDTHGHSNISDIIHHDTVTLADYFADNVNGKVPLDAQGKVPKAYLPEYIQGSMKFKGSISLAAGTTPAAAVNISTIFTTMATNPDEQIGNFYIVTAGGYLKADGTAGGTGFIHSNVEGPIKLEIGDRIIFAQYNPVGPVYNFAILASSFVPASSSTLGVVALASNTIRSRFDLSATRDPSKVLDEASLRKVIKDILYKDNLDELQINVPASPNKMHIYTETISGEPTHTTGTVSGTPGLSSDPAFAVGDLVIFRGNAPSSQTYRVSSINIGTGIMWEFVVTNPAGNPVTSILPPDGLFYFNTNTGGNRGFGLKTTSGSHIILDWAAEDGDIMIE